MATLSSPKLGPTAGVSLMDKEMDYKRAAVIATTNQQLMELDAAASGLSVEAFMRATGQYPCTDYTPRPEHNEMDADYMRAFRYADARERERAVNQDLEEAAAIAAGFTVEQYEQYKRDGVQFL